MIYIKIFIFAIIFNYNIISFAGPGASSSLNRQVNLQATKIKELNARIEGLEYTIAEIKNILQSNQNNIIENTAANTPSVKNNNTKAKNSSKIINHGSVDYNNGAKSNKVKPDIADYNHALGLLKDNKNKQAAELFKKFIKKYPKSELQNIATFWLAESYFNQTNFNKAAITYLNNYKQYPVGPKAPDSLLKLAYSLKALNKTNEACNMLDKLEKEFPNRSAYCIKRAKDAKLKYGCINTSS